MQRAYTMFVVWCAKCLMINMLSIGGIVYVSIVFQVWVRTYRRYIQNTYEVHRLRSQHALYSTPYRIQYRLSIVPMRRGGGRGVGHHTQGKIGLLHLEPVHEYTTGVYGITSCSSRITTSMTSYATMYHRETKKNRRQCRLGNRWIVCNQKDICYTPESYTSHVSPQPIKLVCIVY